MTVGFVIGVVMMIGGLVTGHQNVAIVGVGIMAAAGFLGQLGAWH